MPRPAPHTPARPRLAHVGEWVFDLDNTLYHHRYNLFAEVNERINRFITTQLGLDGDTARRLRREYYESHGTTLRGLMSTASIPITSCDTCTTWMSAGCPGTTPWSGR